MRDWGDLEFKGGGVRCIIVKREEAYNVLNAIISGENMYALLAMITFATLLATHTCTSSPLACPPHPSPPPMRFSLEKELADGVGATVR